MYNKKTRESNYTGFNLESKHNQPNIICGALRNRTQQHTFIVLFLYALINQTPPSTTYAFSLILMRLVRHIVVRSGLEPQPLWTYLCAITLNQLSYPTILFNIMFFQ